MKKREKYMEYFRCSNDYNTFVNKLVSDAIKQDRKLTKKEKKNG